MIAIDGSLLLPEEELTFVAARSSGPGGQHVNKTNTKVTLLFDVAHSPSLSSEQADRLREKLSTRINKEGVLRVTAQRERSQAANKELALARFIELLGKALAEGPPPRRPTRPSASAERARLDAKRRRSRIKRERNTESPDDD